MISINLQKTILKMHFRGIQSHAHLKNSRHAQFNCLQYYQKIPNNKESRRFGSNRSSKIHENSEKNQSHKGKSLKKHKKIDVELGMSI